jgi:hypothetical protein
VIQWRPVRRTATILAVLGVVAAGCASGGADLSGAGGSSAAGGATTTTGDATTTTRAAPTGPRPDDDECRPGMTFAEIDAPTDPRPPIDCDSPHGTETVDVLAIPSDIDYADLLADTSSPEIDEAVDDCRTSVEAYIGLDVRETSAGTLYVDATLLSASWYYPTEAEWDDGARWLRCDVTILPPQTAPPESRHDADRSFEDALDEPVDAAFRECATGAAPGTDVIGDVVCTAPHRAEHLADVIDAELAAPTGPADTAWRDTAITEAAERCGDALTAAIGAPRDDLSGHVNLPDAATALAQLEQLGYIAYACWVVSATPITGTVHGIEDGPLPGG